MNKYLLILSLLFLAACAKTNINEDIAQAEIDVADSRYDSARSSCAILADSTRTDLAPSQLCRVAIIYSHLAESSDECQDEDMAQAAKCYIRAIEINSDSVDTFAQTLRIDERGRLALIAALARSINAADDTDFPDEEEYSESFDDIYLPPTQ